MLGMTRPTSDAGQRARSDGMRHRKPIQKGRRVFLVDTMCGPVESGSVDGYDPASCCTMVQGLPTRYFGSPDQIQKEICDAGFDVLDVSIERNKSHGNMMIQTRKRPTRRLKTSSQSSQFQA
jgi:hypothetical protein